MADDAKSVLPTTENRKFSRRGFLQKTLTGMALASTIPLSAFASIGEAQAGADEFSSQTKPKAPKAKSGKKAGGAAKPAGGAAKPASGSAKPGGGSAQPAGGFTRPETPGY